MNCLLFILAVAVLDFVSGVEPSGLNFSSVEFAEVASQDVTERVENSSRAPRSFNFNISETVIETTENSSRDVDRSVENVSQEPLGSNSSFIESVREIVEDASQDERVKNGSRSVVEKGSKIKDAMEELLEDSLDFSSESDSNSTEFWGIDSSGCDRGLRKRLEDDCDSEYDRANDDAQLIENEREKTEAVCCALEDFEKCSLRAYDKANCVTDKAAIRENLKAARLFLSVIANISCSEFRGQCAFYTSGTVEHSMGFGALLASAFSLVSFLV